MHPDQAASILLDITRQVQRMRAQARMETCALSHLTAHEGEAGPDALALMGLLAEAREDHERLADVEASLRLLREALTE